MEVVKWGPWDDEFEENYYKNNPATMLNYTRAEYEAVAAAARKMGYKFSGEYHQNGDFGVPYFEDGKPFMVTMRSWGCVMAMAWPEEIAKWISLDPEHRGKDPGYNYIAYSWFSPEYKEAGMYNYPTTGTI